MSNQWLRLWHEMPNDPKWRTIARQSKQPVSLVIAVYVHLLVAASRNVTRGHADVTIEDIASALDVTDEEIAAIFAAMQGRVMDGMQLSGWDKRQVRREDSGDTETGAKSAAERKQAQRERERAAKENTAKSECHAESRNVTLDTDTDKEKKTSKALCDKPHKSQSAADAFEKFWNAFDDKRNRKEAEQAWKKIKPSAELSEAIISAAGRYAAYRTAVLLPAGNTPKMAQGWLSGERWYDDIPDCRYTSEQSALIDAFNANIGDCMPTISANDWTQLRASKIDAALVRWDAAKWGEFFAWVGQNCEFNFTVGFDWLLSPDGFAAVKSGTYQRKEAA